VNEGLNYMKMSFTPLETTNHGFNAQAFSIKLSCTFIHLWEWAASVLYQS